MVVKEWRCAKCGVDFESPIGIHRACGKAAKRVFLTPAGLNLRGNAKRIDRLLAQEFDRRGIANYTNVDGPPSVKFRSPGATCGGLKAGWGKEYLGQINQQYGTNFAEPAMPQGPTMGNVNMEAWGKQVPTDASPIE